MSECNMKVIAHVRSDFKSKFGIPRQSGLVDSLKSTIVFTPEFRDVNMLKGIEQFSHLWIIWHFSENHSWSPTVRPPRLGGNKRLGVFSTRSPFRPNPIGISCVKLVSVEHNTKDGTVLHISGGDMLDMTPVFDIKPYIPYTDCHPEAQGGFADRKDQTIAVEISPDLSYKLPSDTLSSLIAVLSQDPRPAYKEDSSRVYGMNFAGFEIKFKVENSTLTVTDIE